VVRHSGETSQPIRGRTKGAGQPGTREGKRDFLHRLKPEKKGVGKSHAQQQLVRKSVGGGGANLSAWKSASKKSVSRSKKPAGCRAWGRKRVRINQEKNTMLKQLLAMWGASVAAKRKKTGIV